MKKILFFTIITCIMGFTSCQDFLEESPKNARAAETFFLNALDATSVVNSLYRNGAPSFHNAGSAYMGPNIMYGGYKSGLYDNQYKGQEIFVQYCQNLDIDANVSNSQLQGIWEGVYATIVRRANYAIKYIPTCPGLTDVQRSRLIAESKFFRALNYFWLVKMFGAVPIITEPAETLADMYVRRSTENKVYALMVEDLESALKDGNLADVPMPENGFRVSKASVAALLADVYLNMAGYPVNDASKYAEAARVAKTLINNANYALIQHTEAATAYDILRTSDKEKEYLYTFEYDASISTGGWRPMYCFPNEAATWGEFTWSIADLAYNPVPLLHAAYDADNDLRFQERQYFHSTYKQTKGSNIGVVRDLGGKCPFFWFEENALLVTNASQKDQVQYRLTEMYLIAAEAIAQTSGVNDEAADLLATIEARASMNKTKEQIKAELLALSKDDFIKEVWTEKIREFIFEHKIWNDITRTRMYPALQGGKFTFVNLIGAQNPWGRTFAEKDLYFPICSQEMSRNPALSEAPI